MSDNGTPATRGPGGRFLPGHSAPGPGNPQLRNVSRFRAIIMEATSDEDVEEIWKGLKEEARKKKPWAIREFLDRIIGKDFRVEVEANTGLRDQLLHFLESAN